MKNHPKNALVKNKNMNLRMHRAHIWGVIEYVRKKVENNLRVYRNILWEEI